MSKKKVFLIASASSVALIIAGLAVFLSEPLPLRSYQMDNMIGTETAKYRLGIQDEIGEALGPLEEKNIPNFAGIYIQNEEPYGIYVAYKSSPESTSQAALDEANFKQFISDLTSHYSWKDLVHIKKVKYSLAELEQMQSKSIATLEKLGISTGGYIDVKSNTIELNVEKNIGIKQMLSAKNITLPEVVHVHETGLDFYQ